MTSLGQEAMKQSGQNSHKKKGTEKIVQVITDATDRHPKCSSSLVDLAKLFDKASDTKYCTKKANKKEILCWVNFGKEFMVHFIELVENSNGKIREKKAKGIIYDEMLEHLATIRKKRSKEMGIQLPKISCSSLTRRIQRSMKLVKIFEKIEIIDNFSKNSNIALPDDQEASIIDSEGKILDDQTNTSEAVSAEISESTSPIPVSYDFNSSGDSSKISPVNSPKDEVSTSSITSTSQINKSNKSRLPIFILPDDPEENSEHGEQFDLNSSTLCPLCNGDHKEESLWNDIRGK
ncbi:hypothetical protein GLOIN_2v1835304 [Rhizophagus clarus]|uniref:Uncharacterized protein n=1 Tax=Rhizophagus clarus TaxID=94130 RepID=A0A8H3L650_9GLOM|nr:hypothetical protein GLOIN_2v1835304 [Rhizophagus clarus]